MPEEPTRKIAIAFIDGQNLFHSVSECFGYKYPNFDIKKLATAITIEQSMELKQIRFYTGVPDARLDSFWNHFWSAKMSVMGRQKIHLFTRPLKYRTESILLDDGTTVSVDTKNEKGIDVRIALDVLKLALASEYDVALIFSQDQDLAEVAADVVQLSKDQRKWIQVCSVFPTSPTARNKRGINQTKWISFDRVLYDSCIDPADYRPKKK